MKTCCFFGHKDILDKDNVLLDLLIEKIEHLILDGYNVFLLGGYGRFDSLSYYATKILKEKYPQIKRVYVQAYYKPHDENIEIAKSYYDELLYLELENTPLRFAISRRNQIMIEMSNYCIFYVNRSYGGAYQALQYAKRKKKNLLNIGE